MCSYERSPPSMASLAAFHIYWTMYHRDLYGIMEMYLFFQALITNVIIYSRHHDSEWTLITPTLPLSISVLLFHPHLPSRLVYVSGSWEICCPYHWIVSFIVQDVPSFHLVYLPDVIPFFAPSLLKGPLRCLRLLLIAVSIGSFSRFHQPVPSCYYIQGDP